MRIEYLDEPVTVEARLDRAGNLVPLAFTWREQPYRIQSWGRRRIQEVSGERLHTCLVQTEGSDTWELQYAERAAQWRLQRHWRSAALAV